MIHGSCSHVKLQSRKLNILRINITYPSNIRRWKTPGRTNPSKVQQLDPKNAMRVEKFGMTRTTIPESNTTQPRKIHYKETRNTLWLLQTLVDQQHVNLISMKLLLSESCWIIILSILSYTEHHIQDSIFMHCTYCSALQLCDWSGYDSFFSSCVERPLMTDMHQQHNNITNRLFQKKNHNGWQ